MQTDLQSACNYAERFIQRLIDCYAYINGFGALVTIERVIKDGEAVFRNHRYSKSIHESGTERAVQNIDELAEVIKGPPCLGEAIFNLNLAQFLKHETALFIYRAVETLRDHFGGDWRSMRESLQIDKAFLEELADYSKPARNSIPLAMVGQERQEILHRGWEIVDRFIIYLRDPESVKHLTEIRCMNTDSRICLNKSESCISLTPNEILNE